MVRVELNNETLFFAGITLVILGSFIMVFDYPQIQFLEMAGSDPGYSMDMEMRDVQQRLLVEFAVGAGLVATGAVLFAASFLKGFKNRFRK